ncbi:MAG: adenylate cyclase class 1 [Flavobacteriales bacterium]
MRLDDFQLSFTYSLSPVVQQPVKPSLIPTRPISDSFDRQNLAILRKRFLAINNDRLGRMRQALNSRHQLILDALPMLFHCNHPMMPGFVSRDTPCKLSQFKPSKLDIEHSRKIARSFTLHYEPDVPEQILGIYVMGSVGTIAQSERSDIDVWLCHQPDLSYQRLQLLQKKCDKITDWAETQHLEAHFFLMNDEAFREGKLSSLDEESSGSAQRLLLLDEFYRSAIFLAGNTPLWWYVPTAEENNFQAHSKVLQTQRFLPEQEVLNFGGVAHISGGEFIGAGIWQLYKAIESPYKSVLKLLLLESYVDEYPDIYPLSLEYKSRIYSGEMNIDALDSYAMIYQRIERYLISKNALKRLELARRCFYFKVHRRLSRSSSSTHRQWQRDLLSEFVKDWGWSHQELVHLDSRANWKAKQVNSERALLVNELNHSYQFLLDFAEHDVDERAISSEELTVLGRKLQAAFERRPGKIEWINPNISKDLSEDAVIISQHADQENNGLVWTLSAQNDARSPLKLSSNVSELLLWAFYNQIIDMQTPVELRSPNTSNSNTGSSNIGKSNSSNSNISNNAFQLTYAELRKLLNVFDQWLPQGQDSPQHENFLEAAHPTQALILLNVAYSPAPELSQQGLQRLSDKTDALRYGGYEENLVVSADVISQNSWKEIHTRHFHGETALLLALEEYLQLCLPGTHQAPPELRIECINNEHSATIGHRVREWFTQITQCFYGKQQVHARYLFQLSNRFYCLQFKGMRPRFTAFTTEEALCESLASEQKEFSPIVVDSRALRTTALPLIANKVRRNSMNIFFRRFDFGMEIYITDEKGSLTYERYPGLSNFNPLVPLHGFIRAITNRQARIQPEILADFGVLPVYFYEVAYRPGESMHAVQKQVPQRVKNSAAFEIKAITHIDTDQRIRYSFVCEEQEFAYESFGDQLYLVVAQYVLSRRKARENYPIYLSDLDLSLCVNEIGKGNGLQLSHYLKIRSFLEFKLNQAIGILLRA